VFTVSTRSRYGLRALVEIARAWTEDPERSVSASEIAANQGIPRKYLESILSTLSRSGALMSVRGKEGGYRLSQDPRELSLLSVIEALDGSVFTVECAGKTNCPSQALCAPHRFWEELRVNLTGFLGSRNLGDLL
jgi:Rrf2 family transcriptional regulator, iron-sulfur cluster assembly transcription factor